MAKDKAGLPDDVEGLRAEVERLTKALSDKSDQLTASQEQALKIASSQSVAFMQREIQEVPTGKMVTVKRIDKYDIVGHKDDGREIRKPVFKDVQLPTYFYKIDLPPSGGTDIKVNGNPFFHGETYELDQDQLRSIKDQVAKSWVHEQSIMGSNENAYRRPTNRTLRGARTH